MRAILYLLHIHSYLLYLTFIVVSGVSVALKMIGSRSQRHISGSSPHLMCARTSHNVLQPFH